MTHIDEWIDDISDDDGERYARFFLNYKRMPAYKILDYAPWMDQFKLFCTWKGVRYRCTGASMMGDVWLTRDYSRDHGYEHRVDVAECGEWGDRP